MFCVKTQALLKNLRETAMSRTGSTYNCRYNSGVDFTKGFKTWHKFSTEIRFMLIPIIVLFIAHEFITGKF